MNEYFITYCFYAGFLLSLLLVFGFGFHWLVTSGWKNFSKKFGPYAFVPRLVGTPVHEIGHLLFAVLTGSKVKRVKLFPKITRKGSGGACVEFTPRKGLLGSLSCFLCGIGPMIICPATILCLMYELVPSLFRSIIQVIGHMKIIDPDNVWIVIQNVLLGFFRSFRIEMLDEWKFWVFLVLAIPIANECVLSGADVKNAGRGFLMLVMLLAAAGLVLSFFPATAAIVILALAKIAGLLLCTLSLSLVFNIIYFLLGKMVKLFL